MKNFKIGENFTIHCYKHDGTIHRTWDEAVLLATHKDYLVFGNRKSKVSNIDGRVWYTKEPAIIYYYKNGKIKEEYWYNNGKYHRKYNPAIIEYYKNGNIKAEYWFYNDSLHREDGPALIEYKKSGKVKKEEYFLNGEEVDELVILVNIK